MTDLGYFSSTTKYDVTATADYFLNEGPRSAFAVIADRAFHIRNAGPGAAADPATVDDFLVPANHPIELKVQPGDRISFILETGETDGSIYFAAG